MKRKFVAFLLSTLFIVPQFTYATSNTTITKSASLEQAILKVKSQLNISDELSKFTYSEESDKYLFNWEDAADKKFMSVTCAFDGDILNYYTGDTDRKFSTVATIDYSEAQKAATVFLDKVATNYVNKLELQENRAPSSSSEYIFYYNLVHDGINLYHQEVQVNVDKQTGQVVSFRGVDYHTNTQFEEKTPTVSLEDAKKTYIDQIGLDLNYETFYDDKTEKQQSFLVYQVSNSTCKAISAKTGKVIEGKDKDEFWYDYETEDTAAVDAKGGDDSGNRLTESEQKEVAKRENLLEADEVIKKLKPFFPALGNMEITSTYLSQNTPDEYRRQMTLEKKGKSNQADEEAWLNVDAATGELKSYYHYDNTGEITAKKGGSEAEAKAFIQKIDPKVISMIRPATEKRNYNNENTYYFERLVNDIPVKNDGIEIEYRAEQVTGYNKSWTETEFKKPNNILTKEQAVDSVGLELVYMQLENDTYALAYAHKTPNFLIDAYTGKEVNYRGEEVTKSDSHIYSDIKGHPYEKEIKNLYYSGIYLKLDALEPDKAITKGELVELLNKAKPYDTIKEKTEPALAKITDTQTITKEQGVASLMAVSPYQKVAELTEIFNYPYKIKPTNDKNKGIIAVAYGLNWLPDKDFDPTESLTRAEAMVYLYYALEDIRQY